MIESIFELNTYIQSQIILYLSPLDAARLEQTCIHMKHVILYEANYWKTLSTLHPRFHVLQPKDSKCSWKDFYRKLLLPPTVAGKRILRELKNYMKDPVENTSAGPVSDSDLFKWHATVLGPTETPYEGGVFFFELIFPTDYPFKPPRLNFLTKILHVNACSCTPQHLSFDILTDLWSPALSVSRVLKGLVELLRSPNFDNPANTQLAQMYRDNPSEYLSLIKSCVSKFAT